ncbi:MAG TPA: radical SAM protein [Firmicutes bacterium]|jgi:radical SAM/Cys-rich protein|nr:radical SAM protein [Bacillota bacterium]
MYALDEETNSFEEMLINNNLSVLREEVHILQLNIGKKCNQHCAHCHVDAGPERFESMNRSTMERVLVLLARSPNIHTVDITGGAPELNPNFKYLVKEITALKRQVIDRCNLTVLYELGQEYTASFLAQNKVQIMTSLPCYLKENVNQQRGEGTFNKSITALQMLNRLGYGCKDPDLVLNLVYNPLGAELPPDQTILELEYKNKLKETYGIEFNRLFTITNIPIKRFATSLQREGKLRKYIQMLREHFNPETIHKLMCRDTLSVSWDGRLYDCDFNQALEIPLRDDNNNVWKIEDFRLKDTEVIVGEHCFGCTAGVGSSCGGVLI